MAATVADVHPRGTAAAPHLQEISA
jgi:hypothetical protein